MVQRLRLHTPNAGGPGLIPGQGTRSCMPQLRAHMPQLKILHAATAAMKISRAATKTRRSQINKWILKKNKINRSFLEQFYI